MLMPPYKYYAVLICYWFKKIWKTRTAAKFTKSVVAEKENKGPSFLQTSTAKNVIYIPQLSQWMDDRKDEFEFFPFYY